jgi:UDP-GlcNAc:undecaprenyl-phosphate GlcNAc-1-phosphate transferase
LVPPIKKLAIINKLVDQPNWRKVHADPIPLIGGLTVFLSSGLALFLSQDLYQNFLDNYPLILGAIVLLIIGIVDDKMDISALLKLVVQVALAFFVASIGIRIESLYGILGIYELNESLQILLTTLVIVGTINAFNLMDGIDGLAAGLAILCLSAYSLVAYATSQYFLITLYTSLIGALLGFLRFNLSKSKKIFMGDAGSLALGFIIVVSGIMLIQNSGSLPSESLALTIVLGVLILPVADSLRVYRTRIKMGYSPFRPDKQHFHHLVLQLGIKHKVATLLILLSTLLFLVFSILSDSYFNVTFIIIGLLFLYIIISSILILSNKLHKWKSKLQKLENRY